MNTLPLLETCDKVYTTDIVQWLESQPQPGLTYLTLYFDMNRLAI